MNWMLWIWSQSIHLSVHLCLYSGVWKLSIWSHWCPNVHPTLLMIFRRQSSLIQNLQHQRQSSVSTYSLSLQYPRSVFAMQCWSISLSTQIWSEVLLRYWVETFLTNLIQPRTMCNLYLPRVKDQIITNMEFVEMFQQNIPPTTWEWHCCLYYSYNNDKWGINQTSNWKERYDSLFPAWWVICFKTTLHSKSADKI